MEEAIKKILKNYVFDDIELPEIEIEKHQSMMEGGKLEYVVSANMPRTNGAFHSNEIAKDIMEKMEDSLRMLGFSKVNGLMIRKEDVLKIQALGYHMSPKDVRIKKIVKFVKTLYTPTKITVKDIEILGKKENIIGVYFDEISEKYITNPHTSRINKNKEENMTNEIRKSIEDFLGIKTSGLQPRNNFFPPSERHGITIVAIIN